MGGRRLSVASRPNHMVLMAPGPSVGGLRTVVAVYSDGRVLVPLGSYGGQNSGIAIDALTTEDLRAQANTLFGFSGTPQQPRTVAGWLTPERVTPLLKFCFEVASAYAAASSVPMDVQDEEPVVLS
jgi:hypothetical protein